MRKKAECPVHGDRPGPLEKVPPETLRYARQGKRFVELAMEYGADRAKNRVVDEWSATR